MIQSRFIRRIQLPGSPGSSKPLVRTRKKRGCVIYVCSDRCCQIYLQRKISERKHCNVAITRAAKKLILLICAMVKIRQAFYKTAWLFLFCNTPCEYSGIRVPPIRNGIPTKRRMIPTSFLHAIRRNVLSVRKWYQPFVECYRARDAGMLWREA